MLPLTSPPIALFYGRYLCNLHFWVLSFVAPICAFALLGALFCGHYLCICPFGCSLLWPLFVHLPFWVLSFVVATYVCIYAFGCSLLWSLFVHLRFCVLSFVATICAFALLGAFFCGRYLCVHLRFWVLSLDWSSLVIPSLFLTSIPCRLLL